MRDYVRLLWGLFTGLYGLYLECWFGLYTCFSLIFFFVSFCLWLVLAFVCVVVLWVGVKEDRRKKIIIIFLYPYRVLGLCAGRNGGGRFFVCGDCAVCVGGLVRWALCVVVLSLGCFAGLSRVFSFRQGTYMPFLRKCLKMDLWAFSVFPCLFLSVLLIFLTFCRFV